MTYEKFSFSADGVEMTGEAVGLTDDDTVTFHNDGTYSTTHSDTSTIEGSIILGDMEIPLEPGDVEFLDETGTWNKNGNTLTINNDEVIQIFKIIKLTDSKLEIELVELIGTSDDLVDFEQFDEVNVVIKFKQ